MKPVYFEAAKVLKKAMVLFQETLRKITFSVFPWFLFWVFNSIEF